MIGGAAQGRNTQDVFYPRSAAMEQEEETKGLRGEAVGPSVSPQVSTNPASKAAL